MNLRIAFVATTWCASTLSALGDDDLQNRVRKLEGDQSDDRSTIYRLESELEDLKNRRSIGPPRKTLTPAEEEDAKLRDTGYAIRRSFDGLSGLIKMYDRGRGGTAKSRADEEESRRRLAEMQARTKATHAAYEKRDAANRAVVSVDAATSRVGTSASVSGLADSVKFDRNGNAVIYLMGKNSRRAFAVAVAANVVQELGGEFAVRSLGYAESLVATGTIIRKGRLPTIEVTSASQIRRYWDLVK